MIYEQQQKTKDPEQSSKSLKLYYEQFKKKKKVITIFHL